MKVCMFHLMPYRDLAPDFDQRYKSAYLDPVWFDVADPDKVGQYYNSTLDEMVYAARHARPLHEPASPERLRLHGLSEPDGLGIGEADERAQRSDRPDRLDAPLDQPADAGRRGICADRLHQRRASGGGLSDGIADRCDDLQWGDPDRAARALSRGAAAGTESVAGARGLCVERQTLPAAAPRDSARAARSG